MITQQDIEAAGLRQRHIYGYIDVESDPHRLAAYLAEQYASLSVEMGELAETTPYRQWKLERSSKEDTLNEIADVLIYLTNIFWALGLTESEIRKALRDKIEYNLKRHGAMEIVNPRFMPELP